MKTNPTDKGGASTLKKLRKRINILERKMKRLCALIGTHAKIDVNNIESIKGLIASIERQILNFKERMRHLHDTTLIGRLTKLLQDKLGKNYFKQILAYMEEKRDCFKIKNPTGITYTIISANELYYEWTKVLERLKESVGTSITTTA